MSVIWANRVLETTTTTGTGSVTLAGAVAGYQQFADVCAIGDLVHYVIEAVDGNGVPTGAWEVGVGNYESAGVLGRVAVIESSTGSAISFAAGTKRVALCQPAQTVVTRNSATFGFFDTSAGVPELAELTTVGSTTYFAFSENARKGLNVKNIASVGAGKLGGFTTNLDSGDFHHAWLVLPNQRRARYYGPSIGIRDATTGKLQTFSIVSHASGGAGSISIMNWDSPSSRSGVVTETSESLGFPVPWYWLHMQRIGTAVEYGFSFDGANPVWLYNYSETSWLAACDSVFFGGYCESTDYSPNQSWTYLCWDQDADSRVLGF